MRPITKVILATLAYWMIPHNATAQQSDNYRSLLQDKTVKVEQTNLPIVFITTKGRTILRDNYILAKMKIIHNGDGQLNYGDTINYPGQLIDYEGDIALKYRANSSFTESGKKPLAFRTLETDVLPIHGGLKKKVKILGMKKDNKWGFIAPWCDETMFRDVLSFELARPWFDWVPNARMCEVIMDGTYYGVYALCERVSKGKHRLNLNDPGEDDGDLTGDYHVAVDHGYDGHYYTSLHHPWQSLDGSKIASRFYIKYEYEDPDNDELNALPSEVRQALHQEIDNMENSFLSDDWLDKEEGYQKYIDRMSFIDYMLSTELSMNIDGYRLSTHLYKHSEKRKETEGIDSRWKLTLWDYNIAWGNANYYGGEHTDQWQYMLNIYYQSDDCPVPFYWYKLLQDTTYTADLKNRWHDYRSSNHSNSRLMATIDSLSTLLTAQGAAQRNEQAWGIFNKNYIWPIPYYAYSYDDAINYLKNWITQRLHFLDKNLLPPRVIKTEPVKIGSGWNADIVAEQLPAQNSTTATIDASNRAFYSSGIRSNGGLPQNGIIISANENVKYQLDSYTTNQVLSLQEEMTERTLTLETPIETSELFILGTSGNGVSSISVRLNYANGKSEEAGTYQIRDWSVRTENLQGNEAVKALGNIRRDNNTYASDNHYCLFDFSVPVNVEQPLASVTFTSNNGAYASIMALSRLVVEEEPDTIVTQIAQHRPTFHSQPSAIYTIGGSQQTATRRGLNIIRYADGTVKKIIVKK